MAQDWATTKRLPQQWDADLAAAKREAAQAVVNTAAAAGESRWTCARRVGFWGVRNDAGTQGEIWRV